MSDTPISIATAPKTETVYRRRARGGLCVTLLLRAGNPHRASGWITVERRADPARQQHGAPPAIATVRGRPVADVLAELWPVAGDDAAIATRLDAWEHAARGRPKASFSCRVQMRDGLWWTVETRHEMAQLMTRATLRERHLYLLFYGPGGALRRIQIADDFVGTCPDVRLHEAWAQAEVLAAPDRAVTEQESAPAEHGRAALTFLTLNDPTQE